MANRIALDWMPHFAALHLGLFCLPMSHEKDARLIWEKKLPPCGKIRLSLSRHWFTF